MASLIGQGLNLALGLAASVPLARGLGVHGKGEFAFYSWAITLGSTLLGWGWHNAVAAVVSEDPLVAVEAVQSSRRSLRVPGLLLALGCLICLATGRTAWGCVAVATIGQIWGQPASGALVGSGRLAQYYAGILTQSLTVLAGLLLYWQAAHALSPERAVAVVAAGALLAMAVHTRLAGAGLGPGVTAPSDRLARVARHAWLATVATFLTYRLDVLFVRELAGPAALGLYSTATGVAEVGRMTPNAVAQAAVRDIGAASGAERATEARRVAVRGLIASTLVLACLAGLAPWVLPLAYGPAFAPAAGLVAWLAPGVALLSVAGAASSWLNVSGRSERTAMVSWVVAGVSAVLSLGLITLFGVVGAAAASSLSYALLAALAWREAERG